MTGRRDERRFALAIVVACLVFVSAVVVIARTIPDERVVRVASRAAPRPASASVTTTTAIVAAPGQLPAEVAAPAVAHAPKAPPTDGSLRDNGAVVQIGTIEIPKIGLVHPVFEGNTLTQIDHGPSHWPGTALPGQAGNAVFAGHRVTHSHPFRNIDQLVPGDRVIFTIDGVRSVYAVTGHDVVTPKDTWIIRQTATPTATLFACHPPHSAQYRYVVHLALVAE